ncbi:YciI family protein [Sorangium sp. So ce542]|uniref:YciI family protein n=1 Tax=Sorangium sp. So ce542 TaxID=3133316 RepID=UPI003F61AAA5
MKFLMTFASNPSAPPPSPETLAKLGEYTQRMLASGTVLLTGGLVRPSHGIQIKNEGGKVTVTDGPFTESKELIDGFAVVNANSKEEAIALSSEFMQIVGDGHGEILQMFEPGGPPPDAGAKR